MICFRANFFLASLIFGVLGLLTTSCTETIESKPEGVSVSKYNQLVDEHNLLVSKSNITKTSAWEASNKYVEYLRATDKMNISLDSFSQAVLKYIELSDSSKISRYIQIVAQFEEGVVKIMDVQSILIEQFNELYELAPYVYKNKTTYLDKLDVHSRKSKLVYGIDSQHKALMDIVTSHYNKAKGQGSQSARTNLSQAAPIEPKKVIVLSKAEKGIGQANNGSGLYIDSNGQTQTMSPKEFKNEAQRRGFKTSVINDSQKMATSMNGVVGMACTNKDLVAVLTNLVSHMKTKANRNDDDLEIALAVDYSGSMSNNIQSVLKDLNVFVQSLTNVKSAGRGVRIGVTTFGLRGKEAVDLDLTSDFGEVQAALADLLSQFSSKQHSMDPGEASYYGLLKTSELSWRSQNRQTIVITDEPAYSLQIGDSGFVNSVIQRMSDINVYPLMVKLCD